MILRSSASEAVTTLESHHGNGDVEDEREERSEVVIRPRLNVSNNVIVFLQFCQISN